MDVVRLVEGWRRADITGSPTARTLFFVLVVGLGAIPQVAKLLQQRLVHADALSLQVHGPNGADGDLTLVRLPEVNPVAKKPRAVAVPNLSAPAVAPLAAVRHHPLELVRVVAPVRRGREVDGEEDARREERVAARRELVDQPRSQLGVDVVIRLRFRVVPGNRLAVLVRAEGNTGKAVVGRPGRGVGRGGPLAPPSEVEEPGGRAAGAGDAQLRRLVRPAVGLGVVLL